MDQILTEAQSRWLRPAEICEILRNYKRFPIASEPPHKPPSGSLFLFDRKILRYFRKDGHNWRKKKDGKTVREAHERLKAGSIDVLHCYYAHGEGNEFFQRRSYWMLEEELSHIVFVHYRHVKGNRECISCIQAANYQHLCAPKKPESLNVQKTDSGSSSSFHGSCAFSLTADSPSMNNTRSSDGANTKSGYNHWISSNHHSFLDVHQPGMGNSGSCEGKLTQSSDMEFFPLALPHEPYEGYHDENWEDALPYCNGVRSLPSTSSHRYIQADVAGKEMITSGQLSEDVPGRRRELGINIPVTEDWPRELKHDVNLPIVPKFLQPSRGFTNSFMDERENIMGYGGYDHCHRALPNEQLNYVMPTHHKTPHDVLNNVNLDSLIEPCTEGKSNFLFATKEHLFDMPSSQVLTKVDSFDKWMSSQLGDVDDSHIDSTSAYWEAVESGDVANDTGIALGMHLECYSLAPSLSQDQLFSIIDFSPNWAYEGAKTKILITGKFLKLEADVANCEWSCMFGEVEVPAELVSGDSLCCWTPLHKPGRIPFYITSSNRIACSEVREFEYRVNPLDRVDTLILEKDTSDDAVFITRLFKFLTLEPCNTPYPYECDEKVNEIISLLMVEYVELPQTAENTFKDKSLAIGKSECEPFQRQCKLKLLKWLIVKVNEGGKGPNVLGESGQGVLHLVAALGYYWAIAPVIISGGNVNFRDVNGWTALHWAASFGRERTVVSLVSQGAAPGALTDPILSYPSGRTPADLASAKGHKGIAGYLAESALSAHLASLNVEDPGKFDGTRAFAPSKCRKSSLTDSDLSYKDSLTAVCNATLAAARIHQVFRVQSFQRKQLKELRDHPVENKFRSWKGRNNFLKIRQRVVKIQAHVRGHQVRKNYRKIVWSVGIVEKVILRWRRKRSGLRGFKSEALVGSSSGEVPSSEEDDSDFLREGRRQTEERLQKALARVKSMVQYPEARDQYRRLLTVVTEIQDPKVGGQDELPSTSRTEVYSDDDLMDIEALLDDGDDSSED